MHTSNTEIHPLTLNSRHCRITFRFFREFSPLGVLFACGVSRSGGVGVSPRALGSSFLFLSLLGFLGFLFLDVCSLTPSLPDPGFRLLISYSVGFVLGSSFSFLSLLGCPYCAHSFLTCVFSSLSLSDPGCPLLLSYSVLGSSFSFLSLLGCPDCAHSLLTGVCSSFSLPDPGCSLTLFSVLCSRFPPRALACRYPSIVFPPPSMSV